MWTLIVFTVLATGHSGGLSSTSVPGYTSLRNCEQAGHELVTKAPDTRYFYSQTERPLFGKDTTQLYSVHYEIIRYGYQCVEVK
ncbi:MAG: hypothetical protein J6Q22_16815 [Prevotella sp.]|nr:hypothetical protein [Prevotella sp.]